MKETFGQRLARLRKEKGLTQEDIANKVGISPQAVSKWENDISTPDIFVLSSLSDILGVSVDELLGKEKVETTKETPNEEAKEEKKEEDAVESEVVDEDEKFEEKKKKEEKVVFDSNGIHLQGDDGSVDVGPDGIYVKDHETGETVKVKHSFSRKNDIINGILFGLAITAYLVMGLVWTDQTMGWKSGWIVLLVPIVIISLVSAIRHRQFTRFAYPVFIVALYCELGFLGDYLSFPGWNFYWFLFITIPVFYIIFGPIDHAVRIKYHLKDDDDDDDDDD